MATPRKDPKDIKKAGRPTDYKPEYCKQILKFFDVEPYREVTLVNKKTGNEYSEFIPNQLPTIAGYCAKLKISKQTLNNWTKKFPEFMDAVTCAKTMAEAMLVINALEGRYNPQFAQFVAKNYTDMRDVKDLNIKDERPLKDENISDLEAQARELNERLGLTEPRTLN